MAFTATIGITLGSAQTGLTLSAQLKDTAGTNVGGAVATGFVELGVGNYSWTYAAFPDAFRGTVVFSAGATVKAISAVNPEELLTAAQVRDVSNATPAAGSLGEDAKAGGEGNTGNGADQVTLKLWADSPTNSDPLADADVWITSDADGGNVVAGTLQTNSAGEMTFLLDAGATYYLWVQKDGFNSIQGQSFAAVAD